MPKSILVLSTWLSATGASWIHIHYLSAFLIVIFIGFVQAVTAIESGYLAVRSLPMGTRIREKRKHLRIFKWCAGLLILGTGAVAFLNDKNQYTADQKANSFEHVLLQTNAGLEVLKHNPPLNAQAPCDHIPTVAPNTDSRREIERLQKIITDALSSQHPQSATGPGTTTPPSPGTIPPSFSPPSPRSSLDSIPRRDKVLMDLGRFSVPLKNLDSPVRTLVQRILHRQPTRPMEADKRGYVTDEEAQAIDQATKDRNSQFNLTGWGEGRLMDILLHICCMMRLSQSAII
jgi:hypothetical protein